MRIDITSKHSIPTGRYHATLSGWQVQLGNEKYDVSAGIRGTAPCFVVVVDGNAWVELK